MLLCCKSNVCIRMHVFGFLSVYLRNNAACVLIVRFASWQIPGESKMRAYRTTGKDNSTAQCAALLSYH